MENVHARIMCAGVLCSLIALAGCGHLRETLPARSAMEQMLISTAADRAIANLPPEALGYQKVFLDTSNLESYDKLYVVQRLRQAVLENGGRLTAARDEAELVLEVASGGLSINKRDYLLGIPEINIPMPFAGGTVTTPELAIFKVVFYVGRSKLLFCALDPKTGAQLYTIPICYGKSVNSYWWVLLFGPFEWTDLPKEAVKKRG